MQMLVIPKRFFLTTFKLGDAPAAFRRSIPRRKQVSNEILPGVANNPLAQQLAPSVSRKHSKILQRNIVGLIAGAGLGTVCVYGALQKSTSVSIIDRSALWPEFVRARLRRTFIYLGASLGITAATAVFAFRSPLMLKMLSGSVRRPVLTIVGCYVAVLGTGMTLHALPYDHKAKHLFWLLHSAMLGLMISPLLTLGGPLIVQAAWYTAGITGSLAIVATCAPSHRFLNWSGPLSIGLGAVILASIGSTFAGPPIGLFSSGLYSLSTYGGLAVFSGLLLYDTQRIASKAEFLSPLTTFDPVNESTSIFLDILNIFTRMVMILAGAGNSRGPGSGTTPRRQGHMSTGMGGWKRR